MIMCRFTKHLEKFWETEGKMRWFCVYISKKLRVNYPESLNFTSESLDFLKHWLKFWLITRGVKRIRRKFLNCCSIIVLKNTQNHLLIIFLTTFYSNSRKQLKVALTSFQTTWRSTTFTLVTRLTFFFVRFFFGWS